jgi:hypothetical protein
MSEYEIHDTGGENYRVLACENIKALAARVNVRMKNGWTPAGGIVLTEDYDTDPETPAGHKTVWFYQAMVRAARVYVAPEYGRGAH